MFPIVDLKEDENELINQDLHHTDVWGNYPEIAQAEKSLDQESRVNLGEEINKLVDWKRRERKWASSIEAP